MRSRSTSSFMFAVERGQPRAADIYVIFFFAIFIPLVAVHLVNEFAWVFFQAPKMYNEGWNALHAERAWAGGALYSGPKALITNNYSPISFYIVGGLGQLTGDLVMAGRLLAAMSLIVTASCIALVIRQLQGSRLAALFGFILFVGYLCAFYVKHVVVNDPQLLVHALMSFGLVAFRPADGEWKHLCADRG